MINPLFDSYIPINTASFHASSSIGPMTLGTILNDLEWLRYFASTQQVANLCLGHNVVVSTPVSNSNVITRSFVFSSNPLRVTLDPKGNPNACQFIFCPFLSYSNAAASTTTASFSILYRTVNQLGNVSVTELGNLRFSGSGATMPDVNKTWYGLTIASSSYGNTSSIAQTAYQSTPRYNLLTRTTKSLNTSDATQQSGICAFDVYFNQEYFSSSLPVTASYGIVAMYMREVGV